MKGSDYMIVNKEDLCKKEHLFYTVFYALSAILVFTSSKRVS